MMRKIQAFFISIRPKTLVVSIVPVILGSALASQSFHLDFSLFITILVASIFIQIGTNFVNEYCDYQKGIDNYSRKGPIRSLQSGKITKKEMQIAIFFVFIVAFLLGIWISIQSSLWILAIGIVSIAAAIFYTAGSRPFGYNGLGELFVFVFFGMIALPITYYCQTDEISYLSLFPGCSIGSIASAILNINNIRDYTNDKNNQKNTLTVKIGIAASQYLYVFLILLPVPLSILYFYFVGSMQNIWLFAFYVFLCIYLIYNVFSYKTETQLIPTLSKTAFLLMLYCLIFLLALFL